MKTKTLRVQGKGSATQAPDRMRLNFSVTGVNRDFTRANNICNTNIEALRTAARECGINPDGLKTVQFGVQEETEYVEKRRQHVGFKASHDLTLILPMDKPLLGRLLSLIIHGPAHPEVKISFEVSDPEALRLRVLQAAVVNAKLRAETIAAASQVSLGPIETIEYGYAEIRVSSESYDIGGPAGDLPDFAPDDVEAEDTVTITWSIVS